MDCLPGCKFKWSLWLPPHIRKGFMKKSWPESAQIRASQSKVGQRFATSKPAYCHQLLFWIQLISWRRLSVVGRGPPMPILCYNSVDGIKLMSIITKRLWKYVTALLYTLTIIQGVKDLLIQLILPYRQQLPSHLPALISTILIGDNQHVVILWGHLDYEMHLSIHSTILMCYKFGQRSHDEHRLSWGRFKNAKFL